MNSLFIGFHQLVQKLERITPIISNLKAKQNSGNFEGFNKLVKK